MGFIKNKRSPALLTLRFRAGVLKENMKIIKWIYFVILAILDISKYIRQSKEDEEKEKYKYE